MCSASVDWVRRRDRGGTTFVFLGNLGQLPANVSAAETQETVVVLGALDGPGRDDKWLRAQAVSRILRALGPAWWLLGQVMRLPVVSWLADVGYRQFARRRHRVSALLGLQACKVRRPGAQGAPPAA